MYRVISQLASSLPSTVLSHVGKVLLGMTKWLEVMMACQIGDLYMFLDVYSGMAGAISGMSNVLIL